MQAMGSASSRVTVTQVRALYGVKYAVGADHAIYVTMSRFTTDAQKMVRTGQLRNLTLIDGERPREWLDQAAGHPLAREKACSG